MDVIKLQKNFFTSELQDEFIENKVYTNYYRLKILSTVMLLLTSFLLLTDYKNYQRGLWSVSTGYEWLFYSHVALGLGMLLISSFYWRTNLQSVKNVRFVHKVYEVCFAVFLLLICAFTSGWIDQRIHGQVTVYIFGCFIVAVFFYLSPKISFWVFLLSYIIVVIGLTHNQPDSFILNGHYINTFLVACIAWFLSLILYKSRIQDFLHLNHLESLVRERTKELEEINQQLIQEIYERKTIQRKIYRMASIVESTDDGIIGMTLDGIIIDWNRGAEFIYGYSEEEIIGSSVRRLFPSDKKMELDKILTTISLGTPVSHFETIRQRKDGQIIHVYLTVSPIKNHNEKTIGASTIVRDVTTQKKIEKEMARMDQMNLVGEMAASIGHEVRNPMTTVRGFLQLLGENKNTAKYSDYIPLMISELDRANHIITEFLSISRTKVTEFASHNLNNIINNNILPLVQVDAIRSEKCVTTQLGAIPDLILDNKEICQMILNLARNGLEAMAQGGNLTIKTLVNDNEVILAIQDEGEGIKPEILDRLGTPFLTTKEMGTGLGLAVCYGIAARHNAIIKIESGAKGTTFFVKFKATMNNNLVKSVE